LARSSPYSSGRNRKAAKKKAGQHSRPQQRSPKLIALQVANALADQSEVRNGGGFRTLLEGVGKSGDPGEMGGNRGVDGLRDGLVAWIAG